MSRWSTSPRRFGYDSLRRFFERQQGPPYHEIRVREIGWRTAPGPTGPVSPVEDHGSGRAPWNVSQPLPLATPGETVQSTAWGCTLKPAEFLKTGFVPERTAELGSEGRHSLK